MKGSERVPPNWFGMRTRRQHLCRRMFGTVASTFTVVAARRHAVFDGAIPVDRATALHAVL